MEEVAAIMHLKYRDVYSNDINKNILRKLVLL